MPPQLRDWYGVGGDCTFMQDGAPCHTAKLITNYLREQGVQLLSWPGNSPDMNPIENVWGFIKGKLARQTITTRQQMIAALLKEWFRDPAFLEKLRKSIDSMQTWIAAIIAAKGGHTKY